jgi:hypothetical protein
MWPPQADELHLGLLASLAFLDATLSSGSSATWVLRVVRSKFGALNVGRVSGCLYKFAAAAKLAAIQNPNRSDSLKNLEQVFLTSWRDLS